MLASRALRMVNGKVEIGCGSEHEAKRQCESCCNVAMLR